MYEVSYAWVVRNLNLITRVCFTAGGAAARPTTVKGQVAKFLNNFTDYYKEDEDVCMFWNSWQDRDQRARIEKTLKYGRFSREKRTLGIVNGRWYCCYTTKGARKRGIPLDS